MSIARAIAKLRRHTPLEFLRGWMFSRRCTSAGIIVVHAGSPRPRVFNRGGEVHVGNSAFFSGVRLEVLKGGRISIGTGTYLNRNVTIVSAAEVTIGRDCKIAWDVNIMDTDQHPVRGRDRAIPVVIEDDVWIGCRAIILKGVRIGRGATIGAGAVVTKDVPAGAIAIGPAATVLPADARASRADYLNVLRN